MSNYILGPNGDFISTDELRHWGFKSGREKENHKYISREWKNGRWRYVYQLGNKNSSTNSSTNSSANKDVDVKGQKTTMSSEKSISLVQRGAKTIATSSSARFNKGGGELHVLDDTSDSKSKATGSNTSSTTAKKDDKKGWFAELKTVVGDKFGFDEKERADAVREKRDKCEKLMETTENEHYRLLREANDPKNGLKNEQRVAKRAEAKRLWEEARRLTAEYEKAYDECKTAESEYEKTPLYRVEKARDWVADHIEDVEDRLAERRMIKEYDRKHKNSDER